MLDKNEIEFSDGDIVDIHQTVNGHNLFVVFIEQIGETKTYSAEYYLTGEKYQYDVLGLLYISAPFDVTNEVEIVGNLKHGILE